MGDGNSNFITPDFLEEKHINFETKLNDFESYRVSTISESESVREVIFTFIEEIRRRAGYNRQNKKGDNNEGK
ncbi:MAG: hypothetical protein JXR48_05655 [Candidatus Delongbacteria bacterium]|nr:hypothetical protein [Candidatus Delongbacteria bacterium]MBN2834435.1 hypothetical protein [Candidatus Delongbacteria bacterium]